ncbi:MAG: sugar phosphate nucleotidyltransferase [Bacteroidia bacterium]|nr:sugar phosphate nucleotidyltransferase [Bacteroidia bacterium]
MIEKTHAVILAGGVGSRFWPASRSARPKQFLDILGTGKTVLTSTISRVRRLLPPERIWLVGNQQHSALIVEQAAEISPHRRLLEPFQRNTAASILWATETVFREDPEALLWILPADHFIPEEEGLITLVQRLLRECDFSEAIFTIGIKPRYPHTGYGYIQYVPISGRICQPVKTFTEKPSRELAEVFLQSGDFLWNSGMFFARAAVLRHAFQLHATELWEVFQGISLQDGMAVREAFQQAPAISFDYAIMEKYHPVMVVQGEFSWWDLGGWNSVHEVSPHDEEGNTLRAKVLLKGVQDTLFFSSQPKKLIIAEGLKGYLVIDTEDALLILPREEEQTIREWVQRLRSEGEIEYL